MPVICSFLLLSSIPLPKYTTIYSSTDAHFGCFQFGTIMIRLPYTFSYESLHEHMFSLLLDKHQRGTAESYGRYIFNFIIKSFPKGLYHFTFPSATFESYVFSTSLPTFATVNLFILALVSTVVILCISLVTKMLRTFDICIDHS